MLLYDRASHYWSALALLSLRRTFSLLLHCPFFLFSLIFSLLLVSFLSDSVLFLFLHYARSFLFANFEDKQLIFNFLLYILEQLESWNIFTWNWESILGYSENLWLKSWVKIRNLVFICCFFEFLNLFIEDYQLFLQVNFAIQKFLLLRDENFLFMLIFGFWLFNFLLNFLQICYQEKIRFLQRMEDTSQLFSLLEVHIFLLRLRGKVVIHTSTICKLIGLESLDSLLSLPFLLLR